MSWTSALTLQRAIVQDSMVTGSYNSFDYKFPPQFPPQFPPVVRTALTTNFHHNFDRNLYHNLHHMYLRKSLSEIAILLQFPRDEMLV